MNAEANKPMIVLIGEAPGRGSVEGHWQAFAPGSKCDAFMLKVFGQHWRAAFSATVNLLTHPQDRSGKGSSFDHGAACEAGGAVVRACLQIAERAERELIVVAAGWRVMSAIGYSCDDYFKTVPIHGVMVQCQQASATCMPHPSGVNRWWNDGANVGLARRWFAGLATYKTKTIAQRMLG